VLLKNGNILVNNVEMSMQVWLKKFYGWASVQTYAFAIDKKTGMTLSDLRDQYILKHAN